MVLGNHFNINWHKNLQLNATQDWHLRTHVDPMLRRNKYEICQKRLTSAEIPSIRCIIKNVKAKNHPTVLFFQHFFTTCDSVHRHKMWEMLLANKKGWKMIILLPDSDKDFFELTDDILQSDTLAPYLFAIYLDYV